MVDWALDSNHLPSFCAVRCVSCLCLFHRGLVLSCHCAASLHVCFRLTLRLFVLCQLSLRCVGQGMTVFDLCCVGQCKAVCVLCGTAHDSLHFVAWDSTCLSSLCCVGQCMAVSVLCGTLHSCLCVAWDSEWSSLCCMEQCMSLCCVRQGMAALCCVRQGMAVLVRDRAWLSLCETRHGCPCVVRQGTAAPV